MEQEKKPMIKVDGFIEKGKQFDIEITLPEDERNVIYGIVKDCYQDPVEDAVVKLIEICFEYDKEIQKPVSHTFTNKNGEFVFGPLCPDKKYELTIWSDKVKHEKICAKCFHHGKCLKGEKMPDCDFKPDYEPKPDCDKKPDCYKR